MGKEDVYRERKRKVFSIYAVIEEGYRGGGTTENMGVLL